MKRLSAETAITRLRYGGHCGFLVGLLLELAFARLLELLESILNFGPLFLRTFSSLRHYFV
jgi:hypothetical protein